MVEWLEERHRQDAVPHEGKTSLETGGYLDPSWQRLLEERGFVRDDRVQGVPHFQRSLDALEPSAPLNGFVIRSVAGEHEANKRAMVQREAFANLDFQMPGQVEGHRSTAPDKAEIDRRTRVYKNVMRLPGYRMDLDLVAVTGGGEFAACCTCWLDSENRVGEFEPVGCHPDFRRRGLTRAVMFEGLRRLRRWEPSPRWWRPTRSTCRPSGCTSPAGSPCCSPPRFTGRPSHASARLLCNLRRSP